MEFNLLPLEIRLEVFSRLPNREVMKIRLVCKQWNGLINSEFRFKQLRCGQHTEYHRARPEREYDFHLASSIPFLQHACNDLKFRRIEYLVADLQPSPAEVKDAFEFLNSLKSLQKARFRCSIYGPNSGVPMDQLTVKLGRLQKLDFYCHTDPQVRVLLDLPSLHYLALDTLDRKIIVGYPEKLRTLVSEWFIRDGLDYSIYTNLTRIYARRGEATRITTSFIEKLPSLREIHLKNYDDHDEYRSAGLHEEESCLPAPPFGQKKVRIFYCGIEVSLDQIGSEGQQWSDLFWLSDEDTTQFITRNLHSSIDNNRHIKGIGYNTMADQLNDNEMFGVMPQKFPYICGFRIRGNVADENRLLKFLEQFWVRRLFFEGDTRLPRSFFEKLAKICPHIRRLAIVRESSMDILSGDLDFIFKFENLKSLHFYDFQLPLNFIARLLEELKSIGCIEFCVHERPEPYAFWMSLTDGVELNLDYSPFKTLGSWKSNPLKLMNELKRRLKVDGYVCLKKLLVVLRQVNIEEQNSLFMMRSFIYNQRHSIGLPKEKMRLLNFGR